MTVTEPTDEQIAHRQAVGRAMALFGSMPYGGLAHFTWPRPADLRTAAAERFDAVTLDDVLDNLEQLRDVLRGVAARDTEREAELYRLRSWVGSVRTLVAEAARLEEERPALGLGTVAPGTYQRFDDVSGVAEPNRTVSFVVAPGVYVCADYGNGRIGERVELARVVGDQLVPIGVFDVPLDAITWHEPGPF